MARPASGAPEGSVYSGRGSMALSDEEVAPDAGITRQARHHVGNSARNSGWYIPYWRKPKRSLSDRGERYDRRRRPRQGRERDVERVREEWVARYTDQVRALRMLGLSVGTPNEDIRRRYEQLRRELERQPDDYERLTAVIEAYNVVRAD
jgi:glycine/D-amino acid oxidase-like deaminating enzyme